MRYKVIGIEHFANKIGPSAKAGDSVGLLIVPIEEFMYLIRFKRGYYCQGWDSMVDYALVKAETYDRAILKIIEKYSDASDFECLNIL
jgi:hypothetical protein